MPPLRIGVNALYLIPGHVGGTEIYLRNLLAAFAELDRENQFFIFTNRETGADLVPPQPNFIDIPQFVRASVRPWRLLWEQTALPAAAAKLKLDCLFNAGFTAPAFFPCPTVTVFHDLQHKRHPEHFRWFDLPFWDFFLWISAKKSTLLIAVSEETEKDLLRYYKLPPGRVRVAPHGVEREFFEIARRRKTFEQYVLCVSTLHPHKNLKTLIRAFAAFRVEHPEWKLVIAGMRGFDAEGVERQIAESGVKDAVRVTGWIPREELYSLFENAAAFVYPSTFEGFGMPVLEAMAAGLPLACSGIEPLCSIARNCAVFFAPSDEREMTIALERVTSDEELRKNLSRAGIERARGFTWEASARATLDAIFEACGTKAEAMRK
jgi:glycosyltransferase involved in cell wall biosynthesis